MAMHQIYFVQVTGDINAASPGRAACLADAHRKPPPLPLPPPSSPPNTPSHTPSMPARSQCHRRRSRQEHGSGQPMQSEHLHGGAALAWARLSAGTWRSQKLSTMAPSSDEQVMSLG
jgi:hypothetical protein